MKVPLLVLVMTLVAVRGHSPYRHVLQAQESAMREAANSKLIRQHAPAIGTIQQEETRVLVVGSEQTIGDQAPIGPVHTNTTSTNSTLNRARNATRNATRGRPGSSSAGVAPGGELPPLVKPSPPVRAKPPTHKEPPCIEDTTCPDVGRGICTGRGLCCSGACRCKYGYKGAQCETAVFEKCPNACFGNGLNCTAKGKCICKPGYGGVDCSKPALCSDLNFCSGHGICGVDDTCTCTDGWSGEDCGTRMTCVNGCSGHGICNVTTATCVCDLGYTGTSCGKVKLPSVCPGACSGHGRCTNEGTCMCYFGFKGEACQTAFDPCPCRHGTCMPTNDKPTCLCKSGWKGVRCDKVDPLQAPCVKSSLCSGHGVCKSAPSNGTETGSPQCQCDPGYSTPGCGVIVSQLCIANCSSHGSCDDFVPECKCSDGYTGDACHISPCPVSSRGSVCDAHGVCEGVANSSSHKVTYACKCDKGWGSMDCSNEIVVEKKCPNACSNNGVCKIDTIECDCFEDYTGDDCSVYVGQNVVNENPDPSEF